MRQRQAVTKEVAKRYRRAGKKEKAMVLDEFVAITEYNRSYGARILRDKGLGRRKNPPGKRIRPRIYNEAVTQALTKVWAIMDMPCGKRLTGVMGEMVEKLERFGEIRLDTATRDKLAAISAATIDRLLLKERRKFRLKGRSWTKPGSLLKHQIPIRTFADWDEGVPGFVEIDLVAHDGGSGSGEFCQTLDVTDVCSDLDGNQGG